MKSLFILIVSLFFISFCGDAQSITWEKQFHFAFNNGATTAIETKDSGFLVPAFIGNDTSGGVIWLIKLNKIGNLIWRKIIDPDAVGIFSMIQKEPGLYAMVDAGAKFDSATNKIWNINNYIEFNDSGDILLLQNYNSATNPYSPYGLLALNNGNYIKQGRISKQMLVQKLNKSNKVIWSDTFNIGAQTGMNSTIKIHGNKIMIGGLNIGNYNTTFSFLLLLDSNGKKLNYVQYPYTTDSNEQIEFIRQLKSGNIMVESSSDGENTIYFTLADSLGHTLKRWEEPKAVIPVIGNVIIPGIYDFVTDGDSVVVCASVGIDGGPLNLIKFDTGFHQIWIKYYDDTSYFSNWARILRTSDNGFLLTGERAWQGGLTYADEWSDIMIIKLDNQGGLGKPNNAGTSNTSELKSISLYPNPVSDNIFINNRNIKTVLNVDIFDCNGTKVMNLTELSPGAKILDVSRLSKGLYMYRIYNSSEMNIVGKFVKE